MQKKKHGISIIHPFSYFYYKLIMFLIIKLLENKLVMCHFNTKFIYICIVLNRIFFPFKRQKMQN